MTNPNLYNGNYSQPQVNEYYSQDQRDAIEQESRHIVAMTYFNMVGAVLFTGIAAWFFAASGLVASFLNSWGNIGWIIVVVVQLALAVFIGARAQRMSTGAAYLSFYIFALTMGFTLSTIFFSYNLGTITLAFIITAAFFLCLTMIGITTKINVLKAGPILMTALFALVITEVIMMVLNALGIFAISNATMIISGITLLIFAGFTVYDAQNTRLVIAQAVANGNKQSVTGASIICALNLYLDIINLFMSILNLIGSNNNN